MFDYRPYVITIAAIFLALASGIVIGITFGENVVVSNQKETIEIMQHQLKDLEYKLVIKQEEVERWQVLEPMVIKGYRGCLSPKKVMVLAVENPRSLVKDMVNLLQEGGAQICLVEMPAAAPAAVKLDAQTAREFAAELTGQGGIEACTSEILSVQGGISGPPDWVVMHFYAGPITSGDHFLKLLGEELISAGNKLIVVYGEGSDEKELFSVEPMIVEHFNTFWGQLTLLELVSGNMQNIFSTGEGGAVGWK